MKKEITIFFLISKMRNETTYYQKNKEKLLNQAKQYYEKNPESLREQAKNKYR